MAEPSSLRAAPSSAALGRTTFPAYGIETLREGEPVSAAAFSAASSLAFFSAAAFSATSSLAFFSAAAFSAASSLALCEPFSSISYTTYSIHNIFLYIYIYIYERQRDPN